MIYILYNILYDIYYVLCIIYYVLYIIYYILYCIYYTTFSFNLIAFGKVETYLYSYQYIVPQYCETKAFRREKWNRRHAGHVPPPAGYAGTRLLAELLYILCLLYTYIYIYIYIYI